MQAHPKKCNITRFGGNERFILKNLKFIIHNMNVLITLKTHFLRKQRHINQLII